MWRAPVGACTEPDNRTPSGVGLLYTSTLTSRKLFGVCGNMALTFLELVDLPGAPRVRIDLPPLHQGNLVLLHFRLERQHLGRNEVLDVTGEHRVTSVLLDASRGRPCPIVQVASTGKAPAWRAVKRPKPKRLAPARSPRTVVQ